MNDQNERNGVIKALTVEERHSIEQFYGVWKTKQTEVLHEVCTPDWQDIPLAPGQKIGPRGLEEIISHFSATFPDVEIVIHEIYGTHERAGVRAAISFTHNADLLGIPSTQKKVSIALHEFHHLKDGKLTHTWHLEDWFGLLMQSGAKKTAVVTGISSGIGLALVNKLLSENYNVLGTTRTGTLDEISHENLEIIKLDVTDSESLKTAVEYIKNQTGQIDLLVNNAGAAPDVFAIEPEIEAFKITVDTNITGPVFFTEPLLGKLSDGARILFISSNMGLPRNADVNGPSYRMSKAAINMYAAMLAKRLEDRSITVTPVHPGWVKTRLGGDQAPLTAEMAATNIYEGITNGMESGRFYNSALGVSEEY